MSNRDQIKAGCIVVSESDGRYLLVKNWSSGKWGFAKGHKEPEDADVRATAIRELHEETLISIEEKDLGAVWKGASGSKTYYFYVKSISSDVIPKPINPREIQATRWFLPSEIAEISRDHVIRDLHMFRNKKKFCNEIKK